MTDSAARPIDQQPNPKDRSSWSLPGSAERNSQPIAQALQPLLSSTLSRPNPRILEVASGFGHQIQAIASSHPQCRFYPTEADTYLCNEINARTADLSNIAQARPLDLDSHNDWLALVHAASAETGAHQGGLFDGVIACNLIHIAPWSVTQNLFAHLDPRMSYVTQQGYTSLLPPRTGWIAIYGAFNEHGSFTSEGNAKFDADIRSRNPEFGLRDIQNELVPLAERHGYELWQRIAMPAGNLFLIFRVRKE